MATTTVQREKMNSLLAKRNKTFERVSTLHSMIDGINEDTIPSFMVRYERLDSYYERFENIQEEIDSLSFQVHADDKVQTEGSTKSFDELYFAIKTFVRESGLDRVEPPSGVVTSGARVSAKLPKLELPIFSGDLKEWPNFYSLFSSTIHNHKDLSSIEKMQYLRTFLRGQPLALIEHLHLSEDNYVIAYKNLVDRYQNKRALASFYLNHILNFSPLHKPSLEALRKHLEVFKTNYSALQQLKLDDVGDFVMFQISFLSLDPESRKHFEDKSTDMEVPSFESLMSFVEDQCKILELSQSQFSKPASRGFYPDPKSSFPKFSPNNFKPKSFVSTAQPNNFPPFNKTFTAKPSNPFRCPFCNEPHSLSHCPKFSSKTVDERRQIVKSLKKCFNCLNNHLLEKCNSNSRCRHCGKNHHSLLHFPTPNNNPYVTNPPSLSTTPQALSCQSHNVPTTVLLGTAQVHIVDKFGEKQLVRMVIDPGSMVSCITESCVQSLGLSRQSSPIEISGVGENVTVCRGVVSCVLSSVFLPENKINASAIILNRISNDLPTVAVSKELVKSFSSLTLADPKFYVSGKIDFLLGADIYSQILMSEGPSVIQGEPTAINSIFGWFLLGKAPADHVPPRVNSLLINSPALDSMVRKFWELEEINMAKPQDPDDIFCEAHFVKTHTRDEDGRYIVRFPFKSAQSICTNRNVALTQFKNLERRFNKNHELRVEYEKFFVDYLTTGHMSPASSPSNYVIPHHPVFKSTSSTTKTRAVFNASHCTSQGVSLNSVLHKGPKLQQNICDIINQFRTYAIPLCADIKQMYRQILVHPDDRSYQHIFWKPPDSHSIVEFELNTVTYGLTPSAFQAQRAIKQLTIDHGDEYPLAAQRIQDGIYIDDIISGADTVSEVITLQGELIGLFQRGGFELRKWTSGSQAVLDTLPRDHLEVPFVIDADDQHTFKILGLFWDSKSDCFGYSTTKIEPIFTKRALLSNIARIFDPMGWLAPLIFWAKHLLQLLWQDNYEWDQPLSMDFVSSWNSFILQLDLLKHVKIPRYILSTASCAKVELIGFCDSSAKGYAAVLYLRLCYIDNTYKISILKAKSKVAPSKSVLSIPRLELCAAVLLSRLVKSVSTFISKFQINTIHLFSDSTVVLCWLKTAPHLLEVFVANRVVEISRLTSAAQWHHVSTDVNPADCASRGLLPEQIVNHNLWWKGPSFLLLPFDEWPLQPTVLTGPLPGLKANKVSLIAAPPVVNPLFNVIGKYSSYSRLVNVFAYVSRFIDNLKPNATRSLGPLLVSELQAATVKIVRVVQAHHFSDVISSINENGLSKLPNNLASLTPFLDEAGLLRVGGRLKNAPLSFDSKHPLLLPHKNNLSLLLCDHFHKISLHGGPRIVQSLIQQKFWILSLRSLLRQRIFKCIKCFRYNAKPSQPLMGDLPANRFSQIRAFFKVGVDFGGPFSVKEHSRRNARCTKGYLCLFVCLSTKAVHLELVSDLSTPAFLAAFDRFVARRGLPSDVYSDNGTNLYGGFRYLQEMYRLVEGSKSDIHEHLAANHIKWHFNPPTASNFGGLFEAGIKSAKHHLKRVLCDRALTFEEFTTLLCRVEAVLNSRPLVEASADPHDIQDFLTPGHFLIGSALVGAPENDVSDVPMNRLTRWRMIQSCLQSFWKVWSRDYLHGLMKRTKWTTQSSNMKVGDVVIVKNQSASPLDWPLGRVVEVFAGSDGIVRVVKLRTARSIYTRPVNKLILLP